MGKFGTYVLTHFCMLLLPTGGRSNQYPQGYYPFEESPAKIPPKVRKPPYLQTSVPCPGVLENGASGVAEPTLDNLCGDLNKGYLPLNPIGQSVEGVSYPFELIKKKTLGFFSKTLPILKADDTLPKVARYEDPNIEYNPTIFHSRPDSKVNFYKHRSRRSTVRRLEEGTATEAKEGAFVTEEAVHDEMILEDVSQNQGSSEAALQVARQGRAGGSDGWCDDSHGVFCMLFNAFRATTSGVGGDGVSSGEGKSHVDRLGDSDVAASGGSSPAGNSLDAPMTPCPSAVEYVTPVFAKNYQGVWRYVVQIPYEGYFTQTVEVVKCLSTKCEYLEGSCLASPRWVSLLVAEIYYPDTTFPNLAKLNTDRSPVNGISPPKNYSPFLTRRQGEATTPASNCDGHDDMGCYQVRLYYDWFLIPGSCKCWKNDFFEQYAKRKRRRRNA